MISISINIYPYFPNALLNNELDNKMEFLITFYLLYLGLKHINYVNMEKEIEPFSAVTNTAIMLHCHRWECLTFAILRRAAMIEKTGIYYVF